MIMAVVSENPVSDPELSAMLDEFEEGTLLSLLEDSDLFGCLKNFPLSPNSDPGYDQIPGDLSELFGEDVVLPDCLTTRRNSSLGSCTSTESVPLSSDIEISPNTSQVGLSSNITIPRPSPIHSAGSDTDVSNLDTDVSNLDSDSAEDAAISLTLLPSKRRRVEDSTKDTIFLRTCVEHDHCYTRAAHTQSLLSPDDKSTPAEEGNYSDTGYETMSSSTSPGVSGGSNSSLQASSSPSPTVPQIRSSLLPPQQLPPINTPHINPVALIDARIKHFMRSQQVNLSEEEKETLRAEGLPIPTTLPLTKVEEKALKSVRRKIRNKMAAQESRKRKKEHVQELEEKVRQCTNQNLRLQKKVESLQSENRSLMTQLKKFQALVAGSNNRHTTKVGACLMVIVVCFAVFLGGWCPQKHAYWTSMSSDYATASVRSRSLLSLESVDTTFPRAVCDWFRYTFLPDKHDHSHHTPPHPSTEEDNSAHTWPDIYLSSYTPLAIHSHNDSHTSAVAA